MKWSRVILFLIQLMGLPQVGLCIQGVSNYTVFYEWRENGWQAYADVYWQVNAQSLPFDAQKEVGYALNLFAEMEVNQSVKKTTLFDTLFLPAHPSKMLAQAQVVAGQFRIPLDSGKWEGLLKIFMGDSTARPYEHEFSGEVNRTVSPLFLSTLQVIDTIAKVPYHGRFEKNGYFHFPRPHHYFDSSLLRVLLYSEIYAQDVPAKTVFLNTYVSKAPYSAVYRKIQQRDTLIMWRQTQHLVALALDRLPSGNYHFNQELRDSSGNVMDKKSLFFQLNNANPTPLTRDTSDLAPLLGDLPTYVDLATTFVKKYDLAQLKAILKMLRIVADEPELAAINGLGMRPEDLRIRNFIYNFWLKRNPANPEKAWNEYAEQIKLINREYGSVGSPGYESDQGILYIRYGKPNDIIRVNNEAGAYPYEIWQYYAVGNTGREGLFLFYQPGNSLGSFTLLHSTVNGERHNRDWRKWLYPGGLPSNEFNSRAIQYFGNK